MDHIPPGAVIAGYTIRERIRRSAATTTYLAEGRGEQQVALTTLRPHLAANPTVADRFLYAGRQATHLRHPNIARASTADETPDGVCYVVGELTEGLPLDHSLEVRWHPDRAVDVANQILDALCYAHRVGVYHGGICPATVLVDRFDWVTLVGFGLDAAAGIGADRCLSDLCYLAPEQAAGFSADACSDIYSLSALLYRLVYGRQPLAVPDRWAPGPHTASVTAGRGDLSRGAVVPLERVIARGLSLYPGERRRSAPQMRAELAYCIPQEDPIPAARLVSSSPVALAATPVARERALSVRAGV